MSRRPPSPRAAFLILPLLLLLKACGGSEATPDDAAASDAWAGYELPEGNDAAADSLVWEWIQAVGGMQRYWDTQSATFTLTTEIWDSVSGRLRRTRPRYVTIARLPKGEASRIERWEGDDFIAQGFNGAEVLWARMNGDELGPGDKDYDEALYVARDVFYWISLPFKLRDPGVFLLDRGVNEAGNHVVAVQFGENVGEHRDTWLYHFEPGRSIPVEVDYIEEGKTTLNRTRWEGFFTVDGYVVPERRVHFNDAGQVFKVIRTHDVTINPEVDPGVFAEPGAGLGEGS